MKKYYDEIYPKYLEKYGKKFDAKVGETRINTAKADDDLFEVVLPNGKVVHTTSKRKEAEATASSFNGAQVRDIDYSEPIRYIDITPKMKEGTSKGQPLFAAVPAGTLVGGEIDYSDPFGNTIDDTTR
jgi:hypothetical protein